MLSLDVVCFSHLRWDFVYQRPQHLMTRFAYRQRVFYIQECTYADAEDGYTVYSKDNVFIVTPHLLFENKSNIVERQADVINKIFEDYTIDDFILWYYTPMALLFSRQLRAAIIVYDCMDELSAFKFAPPQLKDLEKELLKKADIVFTGGFSLYYAKQTQHHNIHPFPSSIDKEHFIKARFGKSDNGFHENIPHPRLGFYGVLDERFDFELIKQAAQKKPQWHFILIGPVAKINPADLPKLPNIHYGAAITYDQLPDYIRCWDGALIPFALNESTKYISPTKTPEYLAAGKPVLSTAIRDVVDPYGKEKLVHIIDTADDLVEKFTQELNKSAEEKKEWMERVDNFLTDNSWNNTWHQMTEIMIKALNNSPNHQPFKTTKQYV